MLAASIAGVRKLDFYTFGEKDLAAEDIESALKVMKGLMGLVWEMERIKEFRSKSGPSVLHYIANYQVKNIVIKRMITRNMNRYSKTCKNKNK